MRKFGFLAGLFGLGAVDSNDIKRALEDKIQEHANYDFVAGWSYIGDVIENELEEAGYKQFFMIASDNAGHVWGVNGNILVDPSLGDVIGVEPIGHAQLWSDGDNINKLMKWLKKKGFKELSKYGGRVPTSEQEVQMDHVIEAVARDLGVSESSVKRVAKAFARDLGISSRDNAYAYWGASGDTELWAK